MNNKLACLCGCGRVALYRGLHYACYRRLAAWVRTGKTTWKELVSNGNALPQKRGKDGLIPKEIR